MGIMEGKKQAKIILVSISNPFSSYLMSTSHVRGPQDVTCTFLPILFFRSRKALAGLTTLQGLLSNQVSLSTASVCPASCKEMNMRRE